MDPWKLSWRGKFCLCWLGLAWLPVAVDSALEDGEVRRASNPVSALLESTLRHKNNNNLGWHDIWDKSPQARYITIGTLGKHFHSAQTNCLVQPTYLR